MKSLHINTSTSGGGAAKSAYDLHTGLKGLNIESNMLVSALNDSEIKKDRVFALGNNYKKILYAGFTLLTGYDSYHYPLLKKKLYIDLPSPDELLLLPTDDELLGLMEDIDESEYIDVSMDDDDFDSEEDKSYRK